MGRYSGRSFRLILMCVISFLLFVMELVISYVGNSLSLASDAFAVLSHLVSMIIGLLGVRVSNIREHKKSTYGFLRADVVGAFGNSVFAVALMFSILIEAIKRYMNPQQTENPLLVLSAGIIGLFFNVVNYVIFLDCCYCATPRTQGDTETDDADGGSVDTQGQVDSSLKLMMSFHSSWLEKLGSSRPPCSLRSSARHLSAPGSVASPLRLNIGLLRVSARSALRSPARGWLLLSLRNMRSTGPSLSCSVLHPSPGPVSGLWQMCSEDVLPDQMALIPQLQWLAVPLRTHTQHKVSSLNAGDSLNTHNEPEETMRKEKKSEALNIR
ncbi:PREDICTED: zinc transporter 10, partial [Galeopterus variegatus]|uniref:Zinc transporter 10 n=1 Tax=Galeopterus variegatus TaxID=482537 RepID=A0ABM0RZK0_GALVR